MMSDIGSKMIGQAQHGGGTENLRCYLNVVLIFRYGRDHDPGVVCSASENGLLGFDPNDPWRLRLKKTLISLDTQLFG